MKFVLALVAVLACASAVPAHKAVASELPKTLHDDWQDFVNLIPTEELLGIVIRYMAEDQEVQDIIVYLLSDDFEALIVAVDAEPTFIAMLDYMEAQGLHVYAFLNSIHKVLGIPAIPGSPSLKSSRGVQRGWRDMWNEILAAMPLGQMYTLHCNKLKEGGAWKTLYVALQDEQFRGLVNAFRATSSWQACIAKMEEYGVHTILIVEAIQKFFNWDTDGVDFCPSNY